MYIYTCPAGIQRCTNVENTLIMVDDVEQPKNNVTRRWKKDVENLTNFQRQYDVLYSEKYRPKHNIKILYDCIVFEINIIISLD